MSNQYKTTLREDPAPDQARDTPRANRILGQLNETVFERIATRLHPFELELGDVIHEAEDRIKHVYFPASGVISLLAAFEDGKTIEAGLLGSEGMLGTSVVLGADSMPHQALVQSRGKAFRIAASDLRGLIQNDGQLLDLMLRYTNALFTQVAQTAGCNRAHTLEQRLARWLLLTHDRVEGDEFTLTQEFISRMLGVRRAGVSVAANALREMKAIDYERGKVTVKDRQSLERASCECYQIVKTEYDRLS